jgi:Tol biopolymer transport system component
VNGDGLVSGNAFVMEPFDNSHSTQNLMRSILAVVTACVFVALTLIVRSSMSAHYRPDGHVDVTFGVAPGGDALVFNASGTGGRDLYLLDLKTLQVRLIDATPDYEVAPEFSPDGKSIVCAAGKPGDRADHIFVRSLDDNSVIQLTAEDANDDAPAFSPDGSLVAFSRCKTYNWGGLAANWGAGVLCVIGADGTGFRQITRDESFASDPHFSPDGKSILFWRLDGLYTVPSDGSQPPNGIDGSKGREAVYSPDGLSIAFSTGKYAPDHRIFVARADGTAVSKPAEPQEGPGAQPLGGCFRPAFMPDGKRIVFFVDIWPDGPSGASKVSLWEMNIAGGKPREIASFGLFDDPLNWKPGESLPIK